MTNAFEYGDALLPQKDEDGSGETTPVETNQPYINLATYGGYQCFLDSLIQNLSIHRSEERRVGKECSTGCRSRWSPYH